jgi:hypothetical protein
MSVEISRDEWLAELERVQAAVGAESGGLTARELCARFGKGERIIGAFLQALHTAGRLETIQVRREARDGTRRWVPTYRIRPETKSKRKVA